MRRSSQDPVPDGHVPACHQRTELRRTLILEERLVAQLDDGVESLLQRKQVTLLDAVTVEI